MTKIAPSARAAPVTIFRMNSTCPGGVDEDVLAISKPEEDPRHINRYTLHLLVFERIQEKRVLEWLYIPLAVCLDLGELTVRQSAAVREEAADDGALAVVYMTRKHYVQTVAHKKLGWHNVEHSVNRE